jgi:hypothetical protein
MKQLIPGTSAAIWQVTKPNFGKTNITNSIEQRILDSNAVKQLLSKLETGNWKTTDV